MAQPSTAQIVAEKALGLECGQACVDWAMGLLEAGCESCEVAILAGMAPPYNHFEVAARRDHALVDLGLAAVPKDEAVRLFVAEMFRRAGDDEAEQRRVLRAVSEMCVADGYRADLYDFHLIDCAFDDLAEGSYPGHWPGATPHTISGILGVHIARFLDGI